MASSQAQAELSATPTAGVVVNSYRSGDQVNPDVFSTGDGKIYVVWTEVDSVSGSSRIFFSMSEDNGVTFSERKRVDDIQQGVKCWANDPVVVANRNGTKVFVAWSDNRTMNGTYQVYMATYGGGLSFSASQAISPTSQWRNQTNPDLAIANDVLYLTYAEAWSGDSRIYVMFASFSSAISPIYSPKMMEGTPLGVKIVQQFPSISVRDKNVSIAWHDSRSNPLFDVYVSTSHNRGLNFADGVRASSPDAVRHWYPTVDNLPSGKVFVAWQEERGGSYDIMGALSTTDDATFSAPFPIDGSAGEQSMPSSSADSRGVVSVVYRSYQTTNFQIMYTRANDATTFITPTKLDPVDADQTAPSVYCDSNGTAYFAFQDDRGPPSAGEDIFFSKLINERPTVSIDYPANDAPPRSSLFSVSGSCNDPDTTPTLQVQVRMTKATGEVAFDWSQASVYFQTYWNITVDSTDYFDGAYKVYARSFDGALYSTEKAINITIINNNPEPTMDLQISSADITYSPSQPLVQQNVTIFAEVHNEGNSAVTNVTVDFYVGGSKIGFTTIPQIPKYGSNTTLINSWYPIVPNTYTITVEVDPDNYIAELNEGNNIASIQIVVSEPVLTKDLAITSENITYSPVPARVNELVNLTAKVSNWGEYTFENVQVIFVIDGSQQVIRHTGRIEGGVFGLVYANWTPDTTGIHTVTVHVNPVEDDDTSNNQATKQITIYESTYKPDLAITNASVIISPPAPKVGQTVSIGVLVQNLGEVAAEQVTVAFYIDGLLQDTNVIPSIDPGMANETSITWQAILGQRTLTIVLDGANTVAENNESNNQVVMLFTVYPEQILKPNLYVDEGNVSYSPDPPQKGTVLKINVTVWNLGNDSAANVEVQLKVDGTQLDGLMTIGYLEAGHSAVVSWNWMPSAGKHSFEVIVDPSNTTQEWNEADNTAQFQVELPADPISPDVYLPILAVVAIAVLGIGIYMFWRSRQRKKGKA
jgi:subtilase family serine protease